MRKSNKRAVTSPILILATIFSTMFLFNNCDPFGAPTTQNTLDSSSNTFDPPITDPGGGSNTGGNTGGGNTTPGVPTPAQQFFASTVLPQLQARCVQCHVQGRAPVRIYEYGFMSGYALQGPAASNNPLYNKLRDINNIHGDPTAVFLGNPSDLCQFDFRGSVSPCKEIHDWVLMEKPAFIDNPILGQINYVSLLGEVSGYAINSLDTNAVISVVVYAGAPFNQGGQLIGTFLANQPALNTSENGHSFRFNLPTTLTDGTTKTLYIYGISAATENKLFNAPYNFLAFPGKARAFYEGTVRPQMTCGNCHFWTYEEAFAKVVQPLPTAPGTSATNNYLIQKMTGGLGHGGGSICSVGQGACAAVSNWWTQEFR